MSFEKKKTENFKSRNNPCMSKRWAHVPFPLVDTHSRQVNFVRSRD